MPEGIHHGDPLTPKIAAHTGIHGYLDIDAVRVTATALQD